MLDQIQPDGTVSAQTALEAFSTAFGPLPGVDLPDDTGTIFSATLAVRWVVQHWSEISTDQQQAALEAVPELSDLTTQATAQTTGGASQGPASVVSLIKTVNLADSSTPGPVEQYQSEAESLFSFYLQKVGVSDPGWEPRVRLSTTNARKKTFAYAAPQAHKCPIVLQPALFGAYNASETHFILAHEVFHCIQGLVSNGTLPWKDWIAEGGATWAAEQAPTGDVGAPPDSFFKRLWDPYLKNPNKSLYSWAYIAFPFFVYLQNHGVDLWSKLAQLPADNTAAFSALAGGDEVLTDWGSGYFRTPELGQPWDMSGPGITATRPDAATNIQTLSNGGTLTFAAPAVSSAIGMIDPAADLITVAGTGTGHIRLADGTEIDPQRAGGTYCTREDGCTCPEGSSGTAPPSAQLPAGKINLAVTGGIDPVSMTLTGQALDCTKPSYSGAWLLRGTTDNLTTGTGTTTLTEGEVRMTLGSDGDAPVTFSNATFHAQGSGAQGATFAYDWSGNGTIAGHLDFNPATSSVHLSKWVTNVVTTINGQTYDLPNNNALAGPGVDFTYACDQHVMTWTIQTQTGTHTWTWTR